MACSERPAAEEAEGVPAAIPELDQRYRRRAVLVLELRCQAWSGGRGQRPARCELVCRALRTRRLVERHTEKSPAPRTRDYAGRRNSTGICSPSLVKPL